MCGSEGGGAEGTRALDQTPTWAVVAVCAVIVVASIVLEGILHHLGQVRPQSLLQFPASLSPLAAESIYSFSSRHFTHHCCVRCGGPVVRCLQWFTRRRKKALFDALEKVKSGTLRHSIFIFCRV